jgi:multidrug efflux pump subunit AcrB
MVTVLTTSFGFLYLIGYTLNVITLFALILGLALIVDDTIIMVEAIDAHRRKTTDRRQAVEDSTRKVSRAMLAATSTAALSFGPLLAVGGILGSFIHSIPITIIASLIISLLVALIFIPFFARFLLLGKKQMGAKNVKEPAAKFEAKFADFVAKPMLWARGSSKRLFSVGIIAILIGMGFLFGGVFIAKNVVFNIFPPTKDTNGIAVSLYFPPQHYYRRRRKNC